MQWYQDWISIYSVYKHWYMEQESKLISFLSFSCWQMEILNAAISKGMDQIC